jgi:hypothetical protein
MSNKSKTSSSVKSSPNALNFKDLSIKDEKQIENVFEFIDKLPRDLQEEVFTKLLSFNPSNASNRNLTKVSKQFADVYLLSRRLSKIDSPEKSTIKQLSKITDKVIDTIGHLTIKKIRKYEPVVQELYNIYDRDTQIYDRDFARILRENNLADARQKYEELTNKKDFDKKVKDLDEHFNYIFSEPDFWFDHNHKRIFDMDYNTNTTKDEKKKIEAFLKANDNITYAEYIKLTRELPIRANI